MPHIRSSVYLENTSWHLCIALFWFFTLVFLHISPPQISCSTHLDTLTQVYCSYHSLKFEFVCILLTYSLSLSLGSKNWDFILSTAGLIASRTEDECILVRWRNKIEGCIVTHLHGSSKWIACMPSILFLSRHSFPFPCNLAALHGPFLPHP